MAVTFQSNGGGFSSSPNIQTFSPISGADAIILLGWDFGHGTQSWTFSGSTTNPWTKISPPGDTTDNNSSSWSGAYNLNCDGTALQTLTLTTTVGDGIAAFVLEYSGPASVINGAFTNITAPGLGTNAIAGAPVTVASGDKLICFMGNATGNGVTITSPGTGRGSNGPIYVFEFSGTGGSITPTFTAASNGSDNYAVYQFVLSASPGAGDTLMSQICL